MTPKGSNMKKYNDRIKRKQYLCASCKDCLNVALSHWHYKQRRMVASTGIQDACIQLKNSI